jgi:synaptojanin
MKENIGYYSFNSQLNKVLSQQAGVVRTNCLDCLDRTNFFMAKMAIITV